ncbi:hypothetical protein Ancab_010688 [Ancistrocladus abbreviatus]
MEWRIGEESNCLFRNMILYSSTIHLLSGQAGSPGSRGGHFLDIPRKQFDYHTFCNESLQETLTPARFPSAAGLMKRLHDLTVQTKGYVDLQDNVREDSILGPPFQKMHRLNYLPIGLKSTPSTFLIHGKSYLAECIKVSRHVQ